MAARTLSLPAQALSAREARRFLAVLLRDAGRDEWLDAAQLAVSEVVTNAVLHAHSSMTLTAHVHPDHVMVEVHDQDPSLPSQRSYDDQATTGRGMALLAAVTSSYGVTALGGSGKVVWFTVGGAVTVHPDDLASGRPREVEVAPDEVRVVLGSMPPTLWLAARQHHDALLRELALFRLGTGGSDEDLATADEARRTISTAVDQAVRDAQAEGRAVSPLPPGHPAPLDHVPSSIDLTIVVRRSAVEGFAVLQDVLDSAERMAAQDLLLARPGLPEIIAIRDWACEQIISQVAGNDASPWSGTDDERFTTLHRPGRPDVDWDVSQVRDADRGAVAADDANRIVAISRSLADELQWDPADLVGRRVVALVPHRFREAHVAGFTRHLTTGEAHAIGVDLELPVIRRDGSELVCHFLIEAHGTPTGRTVYVAWITPLPT